MLYDDLEFNVDATKNTAILDIEGLHQYFATHPGIDEIVIHNDPNNHASEIFLNLSSTKTGTELEFLPKIRLDGAPAKLKIGSKFAKVVYSDEQFQNFSGIEQEQKRQLLFHEQEECLKNIDQFLDDTEGIGIKIASSGQVRLYLRNTSDISFIPVTKVTALKEYCMSQAHSSNIRENSSLILTEIFLHDNSIAAWFADRLENFDDLSVLATAIRVITISGKTEYLDQKRDFVENALISYKDTAPDLLIASSLQFLSKALKPSKPLGRNLLEHLPEFIEKGHTEIALHASKLLAISSAEGHDLSDMSVLGSVITKINNISGIKYSKALENLFNVIKPKIVSMGSEMHKAIEKSFTHLNSEGKQKYVDLVKQFVSDSYKFDSGTMHALKVAVIEEKTDVMRRNLSDLLFDIASNDPDPKCILSLKSFFADTCLNTHNHKFSDSVSMEIIVDQLLRLTYNFHVDLPIDAMRKLNEIAVDKLRPIGLCLKALELLKLSLIYSKEIPVRPVVQRLSEFYDSRVADVIASEILDYLELRFLHGIDDIKEFVRGLKAVKPFSSIAQGLLSSTILRDAITYSTSPDHISALQALLFYSLSGGTEGKKLTPLVFRFAESIKYGQNDNIEKNLDLLQTLANLGAEFTDNLFEALVQILKSAHGNLDSNDFARIVGKALSLLKVSTEKNHILPYDEVKKVIQNLHISYQESHILNIKIIFDYLADQQAAFGADDSDYNGLFDRLYSDNIGYGISFFNKDDRLSELRIIHDAVLDKFKDCSELFPNSGPIKDWDVSQVGSWASTIASLKLGAQKAEIIKQSLPEILAVMMQANKIDTGNLLRSVQILSIASLMTARDKGLILQISTGEGKSTITAISAAIKALFGEKVDVITSSPVLAERDVEERMDFFKMLKISASFNPSLSSKSSKINSSNIEAHKRVAYGCQIVYGDASSFQGDVVKDMLYGCNIREGRGFGTVIVDEVDAMLIDEKDKSTLLSSGVAGMEYLEPVFAAIWYQAVALEKKIVGNQFIEGEYTTLSNGQIVLKDPTKGSITPISDVNNFRKSNLKQIVPHIIDNCVRIPSHLRGFVTHQLESWVDSILTAHSMAEFQNYMIVPNSRGERVIAPVDYTNTGIVNNAMNWSEGLHQFLQLKHNIKIWPESFLTSFISNMTFFQKYGSNIYGMTGTLGSFACREMLRELYDLDLGLVPTYKAKDFKKYDPIIVQSQDDWKDAVVGSILKETNSQKPVLVICETIQKVKDIKSALIERGYSQHLIRIYSRTDNDEASATEKLVDVGEVIIATNLAGRGTDFKLTLAAVKAKGLHVCLTFLPNNLRVEEQAFGRAARSGQPGSGQLITSEEDISAKMLITRSMTHDFTKVERARTEREAASLKEATLYGIYALTIKDELFGKFCNLHKDLHDHDNNKNKLAQLKEDWGLVLTEISKKIKPNYPRDLKDKVLSLGLEMRSGPQKVDSLYQMLSVRVAGEFSPSELKSIIFAHLLNTGAIDSESSDGASSPIVSDDMIMESFARLMGLSILVITKGLQGIQSGWSRGYDHARL